jgi:hypothetical protein
VHVNTDTIGTGHQPGQFRADHKTVSKMTTGQKPVSNFYTISLRLRCIRGNMLKGPKEEEEEVSNFILIEHRLVTSQCLS